MISLEDAPAASSQQQQQQAAEDDGADSDDDVEPDESKHDESAAAATAASIAARVAADDSVQGCFVHEDSVYCVEVHDHTACSGDGNDTAVVWDTVTGDVLHTLTGQPTTPPTEAASCALSSSSLNHPSHPLANTNHSLTHCLRWCRR